MNYGAFPHSVAVLSPFRAVFLGRLQQHGTSPLGAARAARGRFHVFDLPLQEGLGAH